MNTILTFLATALVSLGIGGWVGYTQGQERERTATQMAALKQIDKAQAQTATWREAYDEAIANDETSAAAIQTAVRDNTALLDRMRRDNARAADVPRAPAEALDTAHQGAERDIVRCAEGIDRFGREAAEAARSARKLDAAYPSREDARAMREVSRAGRSQ